jgi:hypothetical protein
VPVYSDEQRKQTRARVDAAAVALRMAAPQKDTDPHGFGKAARALLDIPEVLLVLGLASDRELIATTVPELNTGELLQAAETVAICSADECARYGWPRMVAAARLIDEEGVQRPEGDIGEMRVPIREADGRTRHQRLADLTPDELEAARAALAKAHAPAPPPRPPPPPASPEPAPAPAPAPSPAPAAQDSRGRSLRVVLAIAVVAAAAVALLWKGPQREATPTAVSPPPPALPERASPPLPPEQPTAAIPERKPERAHPAPAAMPKQSERAFAEPTPMPLPPESERVPQYDDPDLPNASVQHVKRPPPKPRPSSDRDPDLDKMEKAEDPYAGPLP